MADLPSSLPCARPSFVYWVNINIVRYNVVCINLKPWLPGCRVLPGRVAGLPGRCRVSAGLPGAAGCRGAAGVLPGCCRVLPGAARLCENVCTLPGPAGSCRVLPGAAGCCWVLPGCRVAGLPGQAVRLLRLPYSGPCCFPGTVRATPRGTLRVAHIPALHGLSFSRATSSSSVRGVCSSASGQHARHAVQ